MSSFPREVMVWEIITLDRVVLRAPNMVSPLDEPQKGQSLVERTFTVPSFRVFWYCESGTNTGTRPASPQRGQGPPSLTSERVMHDGQSFLVFPARPRCSPPASPGKRYRIFGLLLKKPL